jgi:DNA-binding response OmpR family regulator
VRLWQQHDYNNSINPRFHTDIVWFSDFFEEERPCLIAEMKRVLVVDSNEPTLHTFKRLLKNQGFNVDEAARVEEAIGKMKSQNYDLVLVSSLLPDTEGIDLFLFTKESMSKAIEIVTKGLPFSTEIVKAIDSGADAVFAKPVAPGELLRVIEKVQESSRIHVRVRLE